MRLLDLFCGAGGAAMGYHRAGFEVVGVDVRPQPRYPFEFHQADATTFPLDGFDAVHASPPCHDHTPLRSRAGLPWVIENVPGATMRHDLVLCGTMFGLRTIRHRWFEISQHIPVLTQIAHPRHTVRTSTKKRRSDFDAGMFISVTGDVGSYLGPAVMGIDWMTGQELSQAIPPAYTHFIGTQLIEQLKETA